MADHVTQQAEKVNMPAAAAPVGPDVLKKKEQSLNSSAGTFNSIAADITADAEQVAK